MNGIMTDALVSNTRSPQGCVVSPLFKCFSVHRQLIGLVKAVNQLNSPMIPNSWTTIAPYLPSLTGVTKNLVLNMTKTKELAIDF